MHLGLFCAEYPPAPHGGIGSSNQDLAEGLAASGHSVAVLSFELPRFPAAPIRLDQAQSVVPGLKIARLRPSPQWLPYRFRALFERWRVRQWFSRQHARNPFHVIEVPDYDGWLPWGGPKDVHLACRVHGSNLFFDHELGREGNSFEHALERRCLLRADSWIGVSQFALSRSRDLCGVSSKHGAVLYQAVDTDLFSPSPAVACEPGLIVFVNSLSPRKGVEQLIDAVNLLFPSLPAARLALVGQAPSSPAGRQYLDLLRERIRPEFRSRVHFAGRQDRQTGVVNFLRRAQVCCFPSLMETFGIAPIEAMSVGKPTVYSRAGPGPEVIEDGHSGLLCDPRDPADIAAKIQTILTNPSLNASLGQNARARVLRLFSKPDWIRRNIEFFQSCLDL